MALNHSSQRTHVVSENRGVDCCRILMAIGSLLNRGGVPVSSFGWLTNRRYSEGRDAIGSVLIHRRLQLVLCFFCLIVCFLFETLFFDVVVGSNPLSRLI